MRKTYLPGSREEECCYLPAKKREKKTMNGYHFTTANNLMISEGEN